MKLTKKSVVMLLILCVFFPCLAFISACEGNKVENYSLPLRTSEIDGQTVYFIDSPQDWIKFMKILDGRYEYDQYDYKNEIVEITTDLDFSDYNNYDMYTLTERGKSSGNDWLCPRNFFRGVLNGNGHTISNININFGFDYTSSFQIQDNFSLSAIFGTLHDATVTNLKISGVNFNFNLSAADFIQLNNKKDYILQTKFFPADPALVFMPNMQPAMLGDVCYGYYMDRGEDYTGGIDTLDTYYLSNYKSSVVSVLATSIFGETTITNVSIENISIQGKKDNDDTLYNVMVTHFAPIYSSVFNTSMTESKTAHIKNCYIDLDTDPDNVSLKLFNGIMTPQGENISSDFENWYWYAYYNVGVGGSIHYKTNHKQTVKIRNCIIKHSNGTIPVCGNFFEHHKDYKRKDKYIPYIIEIQYYYEDACSDNLWGRIYTLKDPDTNPTADVVNCLNTTDSDAINEFVKRLKNGGNCSSKGGINGQTYIEDEYTTNENGDQISLPSGNFETKDDVWYYSTEFCKEYNGGLPVLRNFTQWKRLDFKFADENIENVSDILKINAKLEDSGKELNYKVNPVYIPYKENAIINLDEQSISFGIKDENGNTILAELYGEISVAGQTIPVYYNRKQNDVPGYKQELDNKLEMGITFTFTQAGSQPEYIITYEVGFTNSDEGTEGAKGFEIVNKTGERQSRYKLNYNSKNSIYNYVIKEDETNSQIELVIKKSSLIDNSSDGEELISIKYRNVKELKKNIKYDEDRKVWIIEIEPDVIDGSDLEFESELSSANLAVFDDAIVVDEYTNSRTADKKIVKSAYKFDQFESGGDVEIDYTSKEGVVEYKYNDQIISYTYDSRVFEYVKTNVYRVDENCESTLNSTSTSITNIDTNVIIEPEFKQKYTKVNVKIVNEDSAKELCAEFDLNSQQSFLVKSGDLLTKYIKFSNFDESGKYRTISMGGVKINALPGYNIVYEIYNGNIISLSDNNLKEIIHGENKDVTISFKKIRNKINFYKVEGSEIQGYLNNKAFLTVEVPYGARIESSYYFDSEINSDKYTGYVLDFTILSNNEQKIVKYLEKQVHNNKNGKDYPYKYYGYVSNLSKDVDGNIELVDRNANIVPLFIYSEDQYSCMTIETTGPNSTVKVENILSYSQGEDQKISTVLSLAGVNNSAENTEDIDVLDYRIGFNLTTAENGKTKENKLIYVYPENSIEKGTWIFKSVSVKGYLDDATLKLNWDYKFEDLYCESEHENGNLCEECESKYREFIESIGKGINQELQYATIISNGEKHIKNIKVFVEYTRLYTLKFKNPVEKDESGNVFETSNATGGSSWLTFTSNLSNVELSPNFTYVKGQSNDLKFNISTIKNNVKYNVNRYYTVDGLKLSSCLYKNGNQVHVYNEVVSGGRLNLSKYGNVFTIVPVIKFNAIKVKIDYSTQIGNNVAAVINASLNGLIYVKDTPEIKNFSNTISGSMTLYFEYGSELKFETGENVDNIDGTSRNALKIIIKESGTNKTLTLTFTTISTEYVSNQYSTRKIFNILHGNEYEILVRFKLA